MNKKMNFFAILPLYGSIIALIWLFIKSIKKEINKKKFKLYFYSCGLMGGISILLLMLFLFFLKNQFNFFNEHFSISLVVVLILGGYLMNIYTFLLLNKKWEDLKILKSKE